MFLKTVDTNRDISSKISIQPSYKAISQMVIQSISQNCEITPSQMSKPLAILDIKRNISLNIIAQSLI